MGSSKSKSDARPESTVPRQQNTVLRAKPEIRFHSNTVRQNTPNQTATNICSIKRPSLFSTEEEFLADWHTWKSQFIKYQRATLPRTNVKWGDELLNLMGPVGQNIYEKFTFESTDDREDLTVLINKFNEYFLFRGKNRLPRENVYEYINDLKCLLKDRNIENEEHRIIRKISLEIDKQKFITKAQHFIPSFSFHLIYDKLTLREITFIWAQYTDIRCLKCGTDHDNTNCPALGKRCTKCNEFNHYTRRCPQIFIFICMFCGGAHAKRKCPAFNETCTKCKSLNHFSWKCNKRILNCDYCGTFHIASRSVCPARNNICSICHLNGHVNSKCHRRHRRQ